MIRGDPLSPSRTRSLAFSLSSSNICAISSMLQPRCAAILQMKKICVAATEARAFLIERSTLQWGER